MPDPTPPGPVAPRPPSAPTARVVITADVTVVPGRRSDARQLREDVRGTLERAGVYDAAGALIGGLSDVSVRSELTVLVLDQHDDTTVSLHLSDLGARAALAAYARECWSLNLGPGVPQPADDHAAITAYFAGGPDGYLITSASVQPSPATDVTSDPGQPGSPVMPDGIWVFDPLEWRAWGPFASTRAANEFIEDDKYLQSCAVVHVGRFAPPPLYPPSAYHTQ
jgi:hypothetical protein